MALKVGGDTKFKRVLGFQDRGYTLSYRFSRSQGEEMGPLQ